MQNIKEGIQSNLRLSRRNHKSKRNKPESFNHVTYGRKIPKKTPSYVFGANKSCSKCSIENFPKTLKDAGNLGKLINDNSLEVVQR